MFVPPQLCLILETPLHSYAYEQLQAIMLFIKDNSSTLYWQQEVKMAFITLRGKSHNAPI